mgnify:CR=1 FL=1
MQCASRWAAAEAAAEPYRKDMASGAQRRKGDKLVTLNVQQIAATQEQVLSSWSKYIYIQCA